MHDEKCDELRKTILEIDFSTADENEVSSIMKNDSIVSNYFCHICFEEIITENADSLFKLSCGHTFCRQCLFRYVQVSINEGNIQPRCFYPMDSNLLKKCECLFSEEDVNKLICCDLILTNKYDRFIFLNSSTSARECPYLNCEKRHIGDPLNPIIICSGCQKSYCFYHANAHVDKTCSEYNLIVLEDEKVNLSYISSTSKPCPNCKKPITKIGGCNHMKCLCGTAFCWLCGEEINDSIFPRHFQWWNTTGCANLQMNSEIEPSRTTLYLANCLSFLQILCCGPPSAVSSIASMLMCPCLLPVCYAPAAKDRSMPALCFEIFTNCLSGWGAFYVILLVVIPAALIGSSLFLVLGIVSLPCIVANRIHQGQSMGCLDLSSYQPFPEPEDGSRTEALRDIESQSPVVPAESSALDLQPSSPSAPLDPCGVQLQLPAPSPVPLPPSQSHHHPQ